MNLDLSKQQIGIHIRHRLKQFKNFTKNISKAM